MTAPAAVVWRIRQLENLRSGDRRRIGVELVADTSTLALDDVEALVERVEQAAFQAGIDLERVVPAMPFGAP